jgi:hypothetical protein
LQEKLSILKIDSLFFTLKYHPIKNKMENIIFQLFRDTVAFCFLFGTVYWVFKNDITLKRPKELALFSVYSCFTYMRMVNMIEFCVNIENMCNGRDISFFIEIVIGAIIGLYRVFK